MRNLLIASMLLATCVGYAHVTGGKNDTYTVDSYGSFDMPTSSSSEKIRFVQQIEAVNSERFRCNGPTALY